MDVGVRSGGAIGLAIMGTGAGQCRRPKQRHTQVARLGPDKRLRPSVLDRACALVAGVALAQLLPSGGRAAAGIGGRLRPRPSRWSTSGTARGPGLTEA